MLEEVVQVCQSLLNDNKSVKDYLNSRLVSETQTTFNFGYFPGSNDMSLLTSLVDINDLINDKLLYQKNIIDAQSCYTMTVSFFEHHPLVMPYRDVYGKTIALVGRSLLNDKERSTLGAPKYKNTTFKKARHLFGLNEAKHHIIREGFVYVVEGQFDVIKAYEAGLRNVVAVGNSNIGVHQISLLRRYTSNIVLLFDNDEAGRVGMERAISKFGKYGVVRGSLPNGYKDLDEYLTDNSAVDFMALNIGGWNNMALGFASNERNQDGGYREFMF